METLYNQDEFKALKCKVVEIGVNYFILENDISERLPTLLTHHY